MIVLTLMVLCIGIDNISGGRLNNKEDTMIRVYIESKNGSWAEEIATFKDEEHYEVCYPELEKLAEKQGYMITESVVEEDV